MKNIVNRRNSGITLIALVVTIVVLIILATVSINAVLGQNGIIGKAKQAKESYEKSVKAEDTAMQELLNEMAQYDTDNSGSGGGTTKPEGGTTKPTEKIIVTVDGTDGIKLTKDNVADYLGRVVSNYKPTTNTVTVGTKTYTVSNNYRLYYIDFEKKYNKDEVSVFLKADCTNNRYALPVTDTTSSDASNIKIKALNPSLYKDGVTSPVASNQNMKAVTWLLNTSNWNSLKTGASLADKVNYVVGAPSVEMMFDSYNTKYNLTESTPNTGTLDEKTDRVKLFYQYPTTVNSNNYGYEVGPSNYGSAKNGYYYSTSDYAVKTDATIDSMYYPGNIQYYWLASPSASYTNSVFHVNCYNGGYVYGNYYSSDGANAFCPLVSLQSTVSLQLQ